MPNETTSPFSFLPLSSRSHLSSIRKIEKQQQANTENIEKQSTFDFDSFFFIVFWRRKKKNENEANARFYLATRNRWLPLKMKQRTDCITSQYTALRSIRQ